MNDKLINEELKFDIFSGDDERCHGSVFASYLNLDQLLSRMEHFAISEATIKAIAI